jgi:hypothetical protein
MKKRQKTESESRIKTMVIILFFIGVMFVIATYAWFATQKNVSIANIEGTVSVAEGLQISLDARKWAQTLDLSKANLTEFIEDLNSEKNEDGSNKYEYCTYSGNNNVIPSELLPVSTLGTPGASLLKMYTGTASGSQLRTVTLCSEDGAKVNSGDLTTQNADYPSYIAFDVFIKDSSRTDEDNALYLTTDSKLQIKEPELTESEEEEGTTLTEKKQQLEAYGLQNTARLALARYSGTADITESDSTKIIAATNAEDSVISQTTIWEPNANYHVSGLVNEFNNSYDFYTPESMSTQVTRNETSGLSSIIYNKEMDTYAIKDDTNTGITSDPDALKITTKTSSGVESTVYGIKNVYDWLTCKWLTKQHTVQTKITVPAQSEEEDATEALPTSYDIDCTDDEAEVGIALTDTTEDEYNFVISANKITKIRVYVWLEGQDVDTLNYASHGGGITVDLGIQKQ